MLITRRSIISGIERTIDLPVTTDQLNAYMYEGILLQNAFPDLTPDQREFILTGTTPEEWGEAFSEVDEE
jgi:hypothetical protein